MPVTSGQRSLTHEATDASYRAAIVPDGAALHRTDVGKLTERAAERNMMADVRQGGTEDAKDDQDEL